ncbi:MAG: hypothetical protein RL708_1818 [Bacteroidota bacterium]
MNIKKIFFQSAVSGFLLWLGFPMNDFTPIMFVALVPLLLSLEQLRNSPNKAWLRFANTYFTFLIWNIASTWWVWNASAGGATAAIILNALLQSFPVLLYYFFENRFASKYKWLILVVFWVAFEKIHLTWEFTWPWLTLGNSFATQTHWIQWYEYTGHLGGSAWIWLANISIFSALFIHHKKSFISRWIKPFAIIAVPILFSFMVEYVAPFEDLFIKNPTQNFLLIQPNIDPYSEKFVDGTADKQLQKLFNLIEKNIDTTQNTIIVFPETALSTAIWLTNFNSDEQIIAVRSFLKKYPKAKLITGTSLIEMYDSPKTPSANQLGNSNKYADVFNASVLMDTTISIQKYYKSKLVPGVERMPYPGFFKFLKPLLIDMGGASDNNGTQEERTNLIANKKNIAAMVCYESIYGSFVSGFVKNDANVLLIITNDGWWGNTPGYKQHFEFAKLRAIETRREVLQCANNGFSGVIDEYGNVISKTDYWKQAAINYKATMLNRKTFFVQYGNELEWLFVFLSLAIILFATFKKYFLKT